MHVVATAGHVDHGKSTLVTALTGMDPDRFAEEKARGTDDRPGLCLDHTALGSSARLRRRAGTRSLPPQHARRSGDSARLRLRGRSDGRLEAPVRGASADPRTARRGARLIASDQGRARRRRPRPAAAREIAARVAGTFLEEAPMREVDAPSGVGSQSVHRSPRRLVAGLPAPLDRGRARLWIDRASRYEGPGRSSRARWPAGAWRSATCSRRCRARRPIAPPGGARSGTAESQGVGARRAARAASCGQRDGRVPHQLGRGQALVRLRQWAPDQDGRRVAPGAGGAGP